MNPTISIYRSARDNTGVSGTLDTVVEKIRGSDRLKQATAGLRAISDQEERDAYKQSMFPAATFSGLFSRRAKAALSRHSSIMGIDIDHIDDAPGIRDELAKSEHTLLAFVSPSGDGVKAFYTVNPAPQDAEQHEAAWIATSDDYMSRAAVKKIPDPVCKDVSRLCFIPHDADVHWNAETTPLTWSMPPKQTQASSSVDSSQASEERIVRLALDSSPPRDYNQWLGMIAALKAAGVSMEAVDAWSRKGDYKEGEIKNRWAGLPVSDDPHRTIGGILKNQGVDISNPTCSKCGVNKHKPEYDSCYECSGRSRGTTGKPKSQHADRLNRAVEEYKKSKAAKEAPVEAPPEPEPEPEAPSVAQPRPRGVPEVPPELEENEWRPSAIEEPKQPRHAPPPDYSYKEPIRRVINEIQRVAESLPAIQKDVQGGEWPKAECKPECGPTRAHVAGCYWWGVGNAPSLVPRLVVDSMAEGAFVSGFIPVQDTQSGSPALRQIDERLGMG